MSFDNSNIERDQVSSIWFHPTIAGDSPEPRAAHSTDLINENKLYLFGGWNGKKAMNDLYVIDMETMQCTQLLCENTPSIRNNVRNPLKKRKMYYKNTRVYFLCFFYICFSMRLCRW
jgi:hypothetical protein